MGEGETPQVVITSKRGGNGGGGRLSPIQPGEVRNPKGINQHTYRRDFERTIDALLRGEISPEERNLLPPLVRTSVLPGMTRGEALASATVAAAFALDEKHLANVLKRVWPETVKHEHRNTASPPQFSPLENLNDEDRATMLRLAQKAVRGPSK
jgi:hypothetical protein